MADRKVISRLSRHQKAQDSKIDSFVDELERAFDRGLDHVVDGLIDQKPDAIQAAAIINSLDSAMADAGYAEAWGRLEAIFADELEEVAELFRDVGQQQVFASLDPESIQQLVNFEIRTAAGAADAVIGEVKPMLYRRVFLGEDPSAAQIRERFGRRAGNMLRTELRTATMQFNRTVAIATAIDLYGENPVFEYAGPLDGAARPFCRGLLTQRNPARYRLSEIRAMDNGQGLDVLTSGGGFNCRHGWLPVGE